MTQLTVKEKEHWKTRICRKVDQAIENLLAKSDRHYLTRLAHEAHELAIDSLGIRELQARIEETDRQEKAICNERQQLNRAIVAQATGLRVEDLPNAYYAPLSEVDRALRQRARVHEHELMGRDELGKQILALHREKEELLDTVWLATSGKQIRELWSSVTELLQESPTLLQSKALSIEEEADQE